MNSRSPLPSCQLQRKTESACASTTRSGFCAPRSEFSAYESKICRECKKLLLIPGFAVNILHVGQDSVLALDDCMTIAALLLNQAALVSLGKPSILVCGIKIGCIECRDLFDGKTRGFQKSVTLYLIATN